MRRPAWHWALGFAAVLVLLNVGLRLLGGALGDAPGGPPSSSYATSPRGLAAWHELLTRTGHPVQRLRNRPSDARLDPQTTVVVLDPSNVGRKDTDALARFLRDGGRLVAGGAHSDRWLGPILAQSPSWSPGGNLDLAPAVSISELEGVRRARAAGDGRWVERGSAQAALGPPSAALMLVSRVGRGRALLLADASPVQNRLLARSDNARLALNLAGTGNRGVAFIEGVHGYGRTRGIAALPSRWMLALLGLALAGACLAWARGRRLGPPQENDRDLPPPRRDYIDAIAAHLSRTGTPGLALVPVQDAARRRLAARAALEPDAGAAELEQAAARFGLSPEEYHAIIQPVRDDGEALAAGRALAKLEEARR